VHTLSSLGKEEGASEQPLAKLTEPFFKISLKECGESGEGVNKSVCVFVVCAMVHEDLNLGFPAFNRTNKPFAISACDKY